MLIWCSRNISYYYQCRKHLYGFMFSGNCDTCIYLFILINCKSSPWCRFFSFWTAFWTCDICRVCECWVQGCMTCLCSCVKYRCALTDRRSRMWSVCGVPRHSSACLICDALPLFCHLLPLKSLGLSSHFLPKMSVFSVVWGWVEHVGIEASS